MVLGEGPSVSGGKGNPLRYSGGGLRDPGCAPGLDLPAAPLTGARPPPAVCGCDLAQSGFFFKNQEYICTHDYQQLYGTRCDSCGDFITGEVISALGRTYHPKCFVCSTCR